MDKAETKKSEAQEIIEKIVLELPDWWSVEISADFGGVSTCIVNADGERLHHKNAGSLEMQLYELLGVAREGVEE